MNNIIELKHITKSYLEGGVNSTILKNVDFAVNANDMISIIGRSGAGKSTALNIIALLEEPDENNNSQVIIDGIDCTKLSHDERNKLRLEKMGIIHQQSYLFSDLTVLENIAAPIMLMNNSKLTSELEDKIFQELKLFNLEHKIKEYPKNLSGGEKQRVTLARCSIKKPKIILADEPTGSLDSKSVDEILDLFINVLKKEKGATIVLVTHDNFVAKRSDKIYSVENRAIIEKTI